MYLIGAAMIFGALTGLGLLLAVSTLASEHDKISAALIKMKLLPQYGPR